MDSRASHRANMAQKRNSTSMSEQIQKKILSHVSSKTYRPTKRRGLARELNLASDEEYQQFKEALAALVREGRVIYGSGGTIVVPPAHMAHDEFIGTFRQNKRGFGFVVPTDPTGHEDLYIAQADNECAITRDVARARITNNTLRPGNPMRSGRILEIIERKNP